MAKYTYTYFIYAYMYLFIFTYTCKYIWSIEKTDRKKAKILLTFCFFVFFKYSIFRGKLYNLEK